MLSAADDTSQSATRLRHRRSQRKRSSTLIRTCSCLDSKRHAVKSRLRRRFPKGNVERTRGRVFVPAANEGSLGPARNVSVFVLASREAIGPVGRQLVVGELARGLVHVRVLPRVLRRDTTVRGECREPLGGRRVGPFVVSILVEPRDDILHFLPGLALLWREEGACVLDGVGRPD